MLQAITIASNLNSSEPQKINLVALVGHLTNSYIYITKSIVTVGKKEKVTRHDKQDQPIKLTVTLNVRESLV